MIFLVNCSFKISFKKIQLYNFFFAEIKFYIKIKKKIFAIIIKQKEASRTTCKLNYIILLNSLIFKRK